MLTTINEFIPFEINEKKTLKNFFADFNPKTTTTNLYSTTTNSAFILNFDSSEFDPAYIQQQQNQEENNQFLLKNQSTPCLFNNNNNINNNLLNNKEINNNNIFPPHSTKLIYDQKFSDSTLYDITQYINPEIHKLVLKILLFEQRL